MAGNGFRAVESKIEKLLEMLDPPQKELVIVNLIERFNDDGNDVIQIAFQPDTHEAFLVVEDDNSFDFQL